MTEKVERDVTKGARLLRVVVRNWEAAHITVESGASRVGVEPCTFWRWLDGRTIPEGAQLMEIERVFGISPRAWFER